MSTWLKINGKCRRHIAYFCTAAYTRMHRGRSFNIRKRSLMHDLFIPEMLHPAPDSLIGDHDPAFRQQIFDVAEAQREPNIEPDRVLDDFGRKAIAAIADFDHRGWYVYRTVTASPPPT